MNEARLARRRRGRAGARRARCIESYRLFSYGNVSYLIVPFRLVPLQGGRTPLHFAAQAGHLDVCTLLITHGGTKSAVSNNVMTPFDLASENGHVAVAQIVDASSTVVVAAPNPLLMLVRQLFGSCQPRGAGR